jgi:23S rRNA pseudouridine955/2504/2580 synthase
MAYENPPTAEDDSAAPPTGTGVQYVEVAADDAGQRLDNFPARYPKDVPRTHIFRLLRKGEVRVNKKRQTRPSV